MDSVFDSVEYAEPIEVQELRNAVNADKYEEKVDLGVGGTYVLWRQLIFIINFCKPLDELEGRI